MLADKGIIIVSWIWQAGGVASRTKPLVKPEDAKGMKVRGGSREMDMMFKDAGASVLSLPSNEIYAAMQTGAMDAALTSSTSLISFRLEEVSKFLTSGRGKAYWFMFEPLLMSKQVFDKLPKAQQDAIMAVGAELEKFALDGAKADDQRGGRRLHQGRRQGRRPRRRHAEEMAGDRASPCGRTTPTRTRTAPSCWRWPRSCCEHRRAAGAIAMPSARTAAGPRATVAARWRRCDAAALDAPSRRCNR